MAVLLNSISQRSLVIFQVWTKKTCQAWDLCVSQPMPSIEIPWKRGCLFLLGPGVSREGMGRGEAGTTRDELRLEGPLRRVWKGLPARSEPDKIM